MEEALTSERKQIWSLKDFDRWQKLQQMNRGVSARHSIATRCDGDGNRTTGGVAGPLRPPMRDIDRVHDVRDMGAVCNSIRDARTSPQGHNTHSIFAV